MPRFPVFMRVGDEKAGRWIGMDGRSLGRGSAGEKGRYDYSGKRFRSVKCVAALDSWNTSSSADGLQGSLHNHICPSPPPLSFRRTVLPCNPAGCPLFHGEGICRDRVGFVEIKRGWLDDL